MYFDNIYPPPRSTSIFLLVQLYVLTLLRKNSNKNIDTGLRRQWKHRAAPRNLRDSGRLGGEPLPGQMSL